MKTSEKPELTEALEAAERQYPNQVLSNNATFFLLKALVLAVCEIADGINQLVADMPSHDK